MQGVIDYSQNPNDGLYVLPLVLTPLNKAIFGNQSEKVPYQYFRLKKMNIKVTCVDASQPGICGVSIY